MNPATEEANAKSERVFKHLCKYFDEYGFQPTIRELQERAGLSSTSIVLFHLKRLEKQGRLKRDNRVRSAQWIPVDND